LSDVPALAEGFLAAIPKPASRRIAEQFLRTTLLQLAMRWGYERHRQLRSRCATIACAPVTLAHGAAFWREAEPAHTLFSVHVKAIASELATSHQDTPASRAAALITRSAHLALDIVWLAREVGVHPATLRRAFRREFGVRPHDYLTRVRVERAELLLESEPTMKLEYIAIQVGWASKKGLYRAFRQIRGRTPKARSTRPGLGAMA
jgi:AraC-like DNA-binding protein